MLRLSADTRLGILLAVLVLAVNVQSVSARLGFLHKAKQVKEYDHWRYIAMSRGSEGNAALSHEPPYCYRLAVPALARGLGRLGLPENAAFYAIALAVLFGFLLTLWKHLGDLGFSLELRAAGLLMAGLVQGAVRWPLYQYWMTDATAVFLVTLAFHLVERERRTGVLLVSVAAAFVRETYVLVYPYLLLRDLRTGRGLPRSIARTAAIAVLPFAVLVAIRMVVVPTVADSFVSGVVDSMSFRWRMRYENQLYVLTIGAFGVLLPAALLAPGRLPVLLRRHFDRALFVVAVYASCAISNNSERPLAYALPVVVPAALLGLRTFLERTGLPPVPVLATAVLLQAVFWGGQRWEEAGMSIYQPVNWTTVAAIAAAWAAAEALLRRGRPARPGPQE
ncbi:MAG: hypothetical protein U0599_11625 [Vicinamibacteria bacterium]